MSEKIKILLFKIQLSLSLTMFFVVLGAEYAKQFKIALFSLALLALMSGLIALNIVTQPQQTLEPIQISSAVISTIPSLEEKSLSESEVSAQIDAYEQLLKLQPTHRDLLINIALLYQAKMDEKRSAYYWRQAEEQDPNSPLFSKASISSL